jgi:phage shock protein PspC (stress-responsive transcriptional regulator)
MFCTHCGNEISNNERFCAQCGNPANPAPTPGATTRRLALDIANKKIAGVCAGIAAYLGWDVTLIRILFLAGIFASGASILVYLVCWIAMPRNDAPAFSVAR